MAADGKIVIDPVTTEKMKKIERLIQDLESGGPCGIVHLNAVSSAINSQIEVLDETGKLIGLVGNEKPESVKIEYHNPKDGRNIGHFTLIGNVEPCASKFDNDNMCLFNVLSELTGEHPTTLKKLTLNMMKNDKINLVKQIVDISCHGKYARLALVVAGAAYNSGYPDDALPILRNSSGVVAYKMRNPGHPHHHAPYRGTTDHKLEAIADELKRAIIAYDSNGSQVYSKGTHYEENPVELDYQKDAGDTSSEWFTSRGGNEARYRAYDPYSQELYSIISRLANCDGNQLKATTESRIEEIPIPSGTYCVEMSSRSQFKTAFLSEFDMAYAAHHVLKLPITQRQMDSLNRINFNENLPWDSYRRALNIDVSNLETDRIIYGQEWNRGSRRPVAQAQKIFILLTIHNGQERNPDAPVHIQTIFPRL